MPTIPETTDRECDVDVLHVDDEPGFADLVKASLEREDDAFDVHTETTPGAVLDHLDADAIDCVVSDYEMPGMDGLELLGAVRGVYPDMPFILFTGKGSEEMASRAIGMGVTDYLQKGGGSERFEVLAHRIRKSVGRYRTEHELERSRQFLGRVLDLIPEAVVVLDGEGTILRANSRAETVLGLSEAELTERSLEDLRGRIVDGDGTPLPDDARPVQQVLDTGDPVYDAEFGIRRPDGRTVRLSVNAAPLGTDDDPRNSVVTVLSDGSGHAARQAGPTEGVQQLEGFGQVLSHDLGNILTIADGHLELARETADGEHLQAVAESMERATEMLDTLTTAMQAGTVVDEIAAVDVGTVFGAAWETQETADGTMELAADVRILADETALLRMFENLIRNSFEHGTDTSAVRVGPLPDGFYVEDDGVGIPEDERETVFEPGYTTKAEGTGIGLVSIHRIALGHGWRTRITDGTDGGARFEFTGVGRPPSG